MCLLTSSCPAASMRTSEKAERGEEEDPHQVDEVTVEPGVLDAVGEVLGVGLPHPAARREQERVDDDSPADVQAVQPGAQEVDGDEVVERGDMVVVQLV